MTRMTQPANTDEALAQAATTPQSVTVGNTSVTERSVDEIIKADRYQSSKRAGSVLGFGLRAQVGIPPGAGG